MTHCPWLLLALFLLFPRLASAQAAQHITDIEEVTTGAIGQYEKFEVGLALDRAFTTGQADGNPYDPEDVSVEGYFIGPGRKSRSLRYGFYYAGFAIHDEYLPANNPLYWSRLPTPRPWRIRFAPTEPGTWQYVLKVTYRDGTTETLPPRSFTCVASASPGFLKVARNRRNFIFDQGQSFFAIGSNVDYWGTVAIKVPPGLPVPAPNSPNLAYCGPQSNIPILQPAKSQAPGFSTYTYAAYDQVFRELHENGGNFARVWLHEYNWDPETDAATLGYYDASQSRLYDFDRLLQSAKANGIYLHLSLLDGIRLWESGTGESAKWATFPYHAALGLDSARQFFEDARARRLFKNKIRYVVSRWGYAPTIASYELINEGDFVTHGLTFLQHYGADFKPLYDWTVEMAHYLKTLDGRHLQTLAYGPENSEALLRDHPELFDYSVSHEYSSSFSAEVQRSFRAQMQTRTHRKPYQLQEYDYVPYIAAAYETKYHSTHWATAFNGSFGVALQLSAYANIHHPCWPAYPYYQPLARFLAAAQFSSAAGNTPIGNAAATAAALYGPGFAHGLAGTQRLTTIPKTANPAYSSPCDKTCPPLYYGSVSVASGVFKGDNARYLVDGVTTSEDGLIEVFALKNEARIMGWVHNKTHYWYNLPHDNQGFCDTCAVNPGLATAPNTITPLRDQRLTIARVSRRGTYTVQWFYTYPGRDVDGNGNPDDGGFLPALETTLRASGGQLTVPIPPLVALGTAGATSGPDYAFVITKKRKRPAREPASVPTN